MGCLKLTYYNETLTRVHVGKASCEKNVAWVWLSVDPMHFKAPNWTPYRYAFNNPVNIIDPNGLFESKADAKEWAKENDIKTGWFRNHKIEKESDGSYAINNRKEGSSYSRLSTDGLDDDVIGDMGDGVINSPLITPSKSHSIEFNGVIAFGGTGINFQIGIGNDDYGKNFWYYQYGPSMGLDASAGFSYTRYNSYDEYGKVGYEMLDGDGRSDAVSFLIFDGESGGDSRASYPHQLNAPYRNPNVNSYFSETGGVSYGLPVGYSRNWTTTKARPLRW